VIPEERWPSLDMDPVPDLEDEELLALARQWPLGAFYRINPFRLDDMQSAIAELDVICASAVVHDGWIKPQIMRRKGETLYVIARRVDANQLGGHAFALVGYNEVGFLVHDSSGSTGARAALRRCLTRTGSTPPMTPGSPGPAVVVGKTNSPVWGSGAPATTTCSAPAATLSTPPRTVAALRGAGHLSTVCQQDTMMVIYSSSTVRSKSNLDQLVGERITSPKENR
jgi:hypothetical protein